MNILMIYSCVVGGLVVLFLVRKHLVKSHRYILNPHLFVLFSRHILLPHFSKRHRFWGPISRLRAFFHALHLGGTLACNLVGANTREEVRSRAGSLALLHLIPTIFFSPDFGLATNITDLSLVEYLDLHKACGLMTFLQSIIHVTIASLHATLSWSNRQWRYGILVSAGSALLVLVSVALPWIRRLCYEISMTTHSTLSIFLIIVLWQHVKGQYGFNTICLVVSMVLLGCNIVVHILQYLYRNLAAYRPLATAELTKLTDSDAIELIIQLPRPWTPRAGQYIYLKAPFGVRFWSFAESHPFHVVWWEQGPDGMTISLLVKIESGFTRALFATTYKNLRVLLDGPYGQCKDFATYDSIVMIATGIGITACLPYMKQILEHRVRGSGKTPQRISLVWEIEDECYEDWIHHWMNQLLEEDKDTLILHCSLYILRHTSDVHNDGDRVLFGRRGTMFFGKPDLRGVLTKEVNLNSGKIIVTVSANPTTRDQARNEVLQLNHRVDFHEFEFQPTANVGHFWAPIKAASMHVGVA